MQVSTKTLKPATEEHVLDQFYSLLADLKKPQDIQSFLSSLMTPTERIVFAKRLQIAWLLKQGSSYDEISKKLNVSSATISSVAESKNSIGMNIAYERLHLDEVAGKVVDKIWFWGKKTWLSLTFI